ncbi:TadE family protein [Streptomyces sp. WMMC940]|uniref:TadE family protein n=1 Tax=Streptomyces sp. WMMC940 TaxID=3015153 RepID=UPI0022B627EB|nr:TadE/TadG family type IV pilus assembly protein [Streptomyces sp. WMMC940]MCZ7458215.1 TadE/TadG family type IV pilus assembly protein [Streptomyces sp. WMMC940]
MRLKYAGLAAAVRRRCSRLNDDRGDAAIEMAIILPVVVLFSFMVVQASTWYYAKQIALTAAREGVQAATAYQSTDAAGSARARTVLDRVAGDSLLAAEVSTSGSNAERVTVTVTGRAPSLLPGVDGMAVSQSASGARERWTVKP